MVDITSASVLTVSEESGTEVKTVVSMRVVGYTTGDVMLVGSKSAEEEGCNSHPELVVFMLGTAVLREC